MRCRSGATKTKRCAVGKRLAMRCRTAGNPNLAAGVPAGPGALSDRMRPRHQDPQRLPPEFELERAILSIRRRLQAHAAPATRYCLIGATAIRAELNALGVCPLPCGR